MSQFSPEDEHALGYDRWPEIPKHRFYFSRPDELIDGANFQNAWWSDLTISEDFKVNISGQPIIVTVFGFQELKGIDAQVKKHLERSWEIIYPLAGSAVMNLKIGDQAEIQVPLIGLIKKEQLTSYTGFGIMENGQLIVDNHDRLNIVDPVVTPAGAFHGTVGNLLYLVVKGMPVADKANTFGNPIV